MFEASKSIMRRVNDRRFTTRYFVGEGIDIGAGADCIGQYTTLFPLMKSVKNWDIIDGDAMLMASVPDDSYDFVHSSHCLEHLKDPEVSLKNWLRICKKGGHLLIIVPDEDLYEQGIWPSTFNSDHKFTFTIDKKASWSPVSINVNDLLKKFSDQIDILKIELLDANFMYGADRFDQTMTFVGESAIEIILRKK